MEDDEDVSNFHKPSIQVDNNGDDNLQNVTNAAEQCEPVPELGDSPRFVGESHLSVEVEPAVPEDGVAGAGVAVEDEESVRDAPLAAESEPGSPKNDVADDDDDDPEEDVVREIEQRESVPEVDELQPVVAEGGDGTEDAVGDKAEELSGELEEPLGNDEKCEPVAELEDAKLVGESESTGAREEDDVDNMVEDKEEELGMILDTGKCELVPESADAKLVVEPGHAEKDGEDEDVAVVKNEEEIPEEAVPELEDSPPVSKFEVSEVKGGDHDDDDDDDDAVVREEENLMAVSEPAGFQLGHELELPAVKEDKEGAIAGEEAAQTEVAELDGSKLVGEAELSVAKEDENEDMVAEEQETSPAKEKEEEDMVNEEQETATPKEEEEEEEEDMVVEEQEIPTANEDEDEDEDMIAEEQETPTADTEMELGRGGAKRKRGKNSKVTPRVPVRKTVEEDVCFICFDGGDLVLCDRR